MQAFPHADAFVHLDAEKTVCFTGHRRIAPEKRDALSALLDELLATLYDRSYRCFICGGALGFDTLAAQRVLCAQAQHPDIQLLLALPCAEQTRGWLAEEAREYERIRYAATAVTVLSPFYYAGCMQVRDRFMVDHAGLCIAYLTKLDRGGTAYTVQYALKQEVPVLNTAITSVCREYIRDSSCP